MYLSRLMLVIFAIFLAVSSARAAQENVMVVLDASGSMWGRVDGQPKIDIARGVMSKVLSDLDGKANIGVVTYGHRKKGDCGDIETIIPVGKVSHKKYMSVINQLSPKGKTPITDAVRKSAEELRYREEKATIVLVSDGLETCEADPCALARQLESQGIDFTVHVIGFDLSNQDTSSLQCLAKETGGKYLAADSADELGDAVGTVVAQAPPPKPEPKPAPVTEPTTLKVDVVLAEGSPPLDAGYIYVIPEADNNNRKKAVASGSSARAHKVEPGKYTVQVVLNKIVRSTGVDIKANEKNRAVIVLNAGYLSVKAVAQEGGKPLEKAYIYVDEPTADASGKRKVITSANQRKLFMLPVGKYFARAVLGKAKVGQDVEVMAGKRTDATIILASGLLKIDVLEQEGGKPQTRGSYVYIYEFEKQADGKRQQITGANPRRQFSLPAGKYYVEAVVGKARVGKPIEVVAGKLTEDSIVVGVGAFKASVIPADGGKPLKNAYIYIYEKEKQLDGSRKQITGGNQRNIFKLPAGAYHVVVKLDQAKTAQDILVTAGKLTEAAINLKAGALKIDASKKMYVKIYAAEKNLDGTRDHLTGLRAGRSIMMPQGKYVLIGKEGDKTVEAEADIKAGKLTEVTMKP